MNTFYFTVINPNTNKEAIVRHPAVSLEMAKKVLVIKCGADILNNILEVRVGNKVIA